jgi:antitoxin YefM
MGSEELNVDVITYSDARKRLKELMDRVVGDRTEVVVTRQKAEPVVVVSMSEWNAISETLHLLSTPRNAERLISAIRQLESGNGKERKLIGADEPAAA